MIPQKVVAAEGRSEPLQRVALNGSAISPALLATTGREAPAYELKFLLTERQAHEVEERASDRMVYDPHADPAAGNAYRITSLYLDTAGFDVFHRVGAFKRRKHRLRRYDQEPVIFLERKRKWGDRVKKRRMLIPDSELAMLANPMSLTDWPGHWFHRHLLRRQLLPVCRITYDRVALVGQSAEGPLRLTFDRNVCGLLTRTWDVNPLDDGQLVLADRVICEFKYQGYMPALFKEIIQAMQLTPTPVSKYRTFLRASGCVSDKRIIDV